MDTFPDTIEINLDRPSYTGSVQKLYDVPGRPDLLISETSEGGSVFDVGTIFTIKGSDIGRASFRHMVFQELQNPEAWRVVSKIVSRETSFMGKDKSGLIRNILSRYCEKGALTHHGGMVERESGRVFSRGFPPRLSNLTLIKKYAVIKPELSRVLGWHFYDYEKFHHKDRNVIPLEYIVRLGITSGSSILRKHNAMSDSGKRDYLRELGIDTPLSPWVRFDHPIVDLTTKYEPEDRNISRQEGALISGLGASAFSESLAMAILGAYLLQHIFSGMGLFLWDLKWEIARDGEDLVFVDTIDTDSVRVTFNLVRGSRSYFVHFNKQAMRDYYKIMHGEWYNAVNEAKVLAAQSGRPFTEVLADGQKRKDYPPTPAVDRAFLDIQKAKFEMIQSFIKDQGQDLRKEAERIAGSEIDYYQSSDNLEQYEVLNAI